VHALLETLDALDALLLGCEMCLAGTGAWLMRCCWLLAVPCWDWCLVDALLLAAGYALLGLVLG
jgi:hypothetical protein